VCIYVYLRVGVMPSSMQLNVFESASYEPCA